VIDGNGNIVGTSEIIGGRHNDSYEVRETISKVFADLKRNRLEYQSAFFNADGGFDTN
jgi:fructosamine-3-kinase